MIIEGECDSHNKHRIIIKPKKKRMNNLTLLFLIIFLQKWEQDSLLLQMERNKLDVVHIGDDVWTGLFSDKFTRDYSTDSLDVYDFDSVDDLVVKHIYKEMANPNVKLVIGNKSNKIMCFFFCG